MPKFYITNAIPYVNAKPHIGHALEFIQSDVIARYHKLIGDDVKLLCGGDENAIKNVQAAEKAHEPVQEFVDKNNLFFEDLVKALNTGFDIWQKGSSEQHFKSSQTLWELCQKNGDIYKKKYKGLYCVGCELFYTREELDENGECYEHPGKPLEEIAEENYFFKLSNYTEKILQLIESDTLKIVPDFRRNEVLAFLKKGLEDISISRSNERAKNWGVPVPGDDTQRMYVWFDALNIYQSGIGFGWDEKKYEKWWPADIQVIGKGIIRFHAIYWPAFLLSAKLKPAKKIFVHEYFTVNGQKMSKTLGNVIDPIELIDAYGADALRFYCLRYFSPFSDGDFSEEKFKIAYNADLANGLGNAVSRVAKLAENSGFDFEEEKPAKEIYSKEIKQIFEEFKFNEVLQHLWIVRLAIIDKHINDERPWSIKDKDTLKHVLQQEIDMLRELARQIAPFLPETSEKILKQFKGPKIKSEKPLFPRL